MCIFRTPPSLQITNFCVILSTPGGELSVGSFSEVSYNRFSVGREWRVLELVRKRELVEAPCQCADSD